MRSTSGAHIFVFGDRVLKWGRGAVGRRIGEQGRYCTALGHVAPEVFWQGRNWYVMERLEPYVVHSIQDTVQDVINILDEKVWFSLDAPIVTLRHYHYVANKATPLHPRYWQAIKDIFRLVPWEELPATWTHGDPTFDNIMLGRESGAKVLTDPLPMTAYMPATPAVDLGKIMQSLYGYEYVKAGLPPYADPIPPAHRLAMAGVDGDQIAAALYFCAVHFVRLLPYQPEQRRGDYVALLDRVLYDARVRLNA